MIPRLLVLSLVLLLLLLLLVLLLLALLILVAVLAVVRACPAPLGEGGGGGEWTSLCSADARSLSPALLVSLATLELLWREVSAVMLELLETVVA